MSTIRIIYTNSQNLVEPSDFVSLSASIFLVDMYWKMIYLSSTNFFDSWCLMGICFVFLWYSKMFAGLMTIYVMTWSRDQATWPILTLLHLLRYHHLDFDLRPYPVTPGTTFRPCATYLGTTFRPCLVHHPFRFTIRPARDGTHLRRAKTFRTQLSPLDTLLNIISRKNTIAQYHPARCYRSISLL